MACRRLRGSGARAAALLLLAAASAQAQIAVNSSPNSVGSGARALGMGGAFIAVADDATAASWNPGGLTQLEAPEVSLVWNWKYSSEEFNSGSHPELEGEFDLDRNDLNYFSIAYPIQRTIAGRNLVVSLNLQRKFDFDRELNVAFRDITALSSGDIFRVQHRVWYEQDGSLTALSPAFGFELTDNLSVGVVANIWNEALVPGNQWENTTRFRTRSWTLATPVAFTNGEFREKYEDFEGVNYTFGVLYRATEHLQIGAVYNTKFHADVKWTQINRIRGAVNAVTVNREHRRLEFPSSLGLGIAYRFPNDKLTLSLDVTRRNWDEFVEVDRRGVRTSPITGIVKQRSFHEPTYTVRVGGEYVFVDPSRPVQKYLPSLRAGFFYDPEPAGNQPDRINGGLGPVTGEPDKYYGFTLGAGLLIKNRVNLDAAYQYRWGDNVRKDSFQIHSTDADVDQHEFYLSTVIYF